MQYSDFDMQIKCFSINQSVFDLIGETRREEMRIFYERSANPEPTNIQFAP